jgi:hypothetical protein
MLGVVRAQIVALGQAEGAAVPSVAAVIRSGHSHALDAGTYSLGIRFKGAPISCGLLNSYALTCSMNGYEGRGLAL